MNYEMQSLTMKAEQGDAVAQYNLAEKYYNGVGISLNYEKAVYWYKKAAGQGNLDAEYSLGFCYKNGKGVFKNFRRAVKLLKHAAEQGHANAQDCLAHCYSDGEGVFKDVRLAMYWWEKAAEQGHAEAQSCLGISYYMNYRNLSKATYWLEKAIKQGNNVAKQAMVIIERDLQKQTSKNIEKKDYTSVKEDNTVKDFNNTYGEGSRELKERVCQEMKMGGSGDGNNIAIYYDSYSREWKAVDYWDSEYSLTEDIWGAEWATTRYKCSNGKIYVLPTNSPDKEKIYFFYN